MPRSVALALTLSAALMACAQSPNDPGPTQPTTDAAPDPAVTYNQRVACLGDKWAPILNAGEQGVALKETITEGGRQIHAYEFTGLSGNYPKVLGFFLFDGTCYQKAVTFGSYVYVTTLNRELGRIGADERAYHADSYAPGEHASLSFSKKPPVYERARKQALSRL